jgi:hypothetical protein
VGKKGIVRGYAVCSLGLARTYLIGPGCILAVLRLRRPWLLLLLLLLLRLLLLLLLGLLLLRLLLLLLLRLLLLLLLRRRRSLISRRLLLRRSLLLLLHGRVGSPLRSGRRLLVTHDGRDGVGGSGDDGARRDGKTFAREWYRDMRFMMQAELKLHEGREGARLSPRISMARFERAWIGSDRIGGRVVAR